jgi:hypothetical protein
MILIDLNSEKRWMKINNPKLLPEKYSMVIDMLGKTIKKSS